MDDLIAKVRAVLSATPARWAGLTAALPIDLMTLAPAAGEWSALECLEHLVAAEGAVFPVRIRAILAGRDFAAYDPDAAGSRSAGADPADLAARFARLRSESLELLGGVSDADLGRTARHAELGIVTMAQLLHEWAGHDLMHTVQAERALLQPFIAGAGPWRPYFADHDVGERAE